ncbi:S1C family serine protease [Gemmatimonas groenlandica]|uniref:Serine protease n=1 Tax=Gemmatimonas groenlandica TaxID=2732249 RepID=A0A6M4IST6_9BACT|nr:S1C family serine protease [Gemmatimonas groenlandica]QJR37255.1 serine protease [Gemmatimonas groenlandica]
MPTESSATSTIDLQSAQVDGGHMIAHATAGVVHVEAGEGRSTHSGAGVVWARDANGRCLIVSNAHVVTHEPITLTGADGVTRRATLVARDTVRDLALVSCDDAPASWRPVPPADKAPLRVGQVVMAVGHPLGVRHAITTGVVHAIGPLRSDAELPLPQRALPWAQLDVRLAPGNSGGPVVDAHGAMVGVSTMIARGLGLAVPIADVDAFVARVGATARLAHGWSRGWRAR